MTSVGVWLEGPERETYKGLLREADAEVFADLDFAGLVPTEAERDEADSVTARFDRKRRVRGRKEAA